MEIWGRIDLVQAVGWVQSTPGQCMGLEEGEEGPEGFVAAGRRKASQWGMGSSGRKISGFVSR